MKNVSWAVSVWEACGKEIRTKGHAYIGSATNKDTAILWAHAPIAHDLCKRMCSDTPPTQEEILQYLENFK